MNIKTASLTGLALLALACNDADLITQPEQPEPTIPVTSLEYSDVYLTQGERKVDVLWVVDDSGSMGGEQDKLIADFAAFIQDFTDLGLDFQIAVVTTDVDDTNNHRGRIQGNIMTPDTVDIIAEFSQTAVVGTNGSGGVEEQGLEAARLALSADALSTFNAGFLRDDAVLSIIMVSDEDDQSTPSDIGGVQCVGPNQDTSACAPVADYVDFFQSLKTRDDLVQINVIVGDTPDGCSNQYASADAAPRYHEAAALTGGATESICRETFGPALDHLGDVVSELARTEFPTTFMPLAETIEVTVNGAPTSAWEYDKEAGTIVFDGDLDPDACTEVQIRYEYADETVLPTAPVDTVDRQCFASSIEVEDPETVGPLGGELNGGSVAACSTVPGGSSRAPIWLIALLGGAAVLASRLRRRLIQTDEPSVA